MTHPRIFGLIGRDIGYSFSAGYFTEKFKREGLEYCEYRNFDIPDIGEVGPLLQRGDISGLNVTIPYKESIIPYLDGLSPTAAEIGAVNTVSFRNGKAIGHNTDHIGFAKSLMTLLRPHHKKALVLGTGGASKAVVYAFGTLGIPCLVASRGSKPGTIPYDRIDASCFLSHTIVVNCTPLGTSPGIEAFPPIPYEHFSPDHLAYDLIYNPEKTVFLQKAESCGAVIQNGYEMLVFQAEAAWDVWTS